MQFKDIVLSPDAFNYLAKRKLIKQFNKAARYIIEWDAKSAQLKKMKPNSSGIFYFRINRQYRAICKIEENILFVYYIDNHQ